jgi:anti-anti-sigma factor
MDEVPDRTTVSPQATHLLQIRVARVVDAPVVMLTGEVDLGTVDHLAAALEGLDGRVVIDLGDLSFLDCSGIGVLVAARKRLRAGGGDLHLRSPRVAVRSVLELLGLRGWIIEDPAPAR